MWWVLPEVRPLIFYSERIMDSQEFFRKKARAKVQSAVLVLTLVALAALAVEHRRASAPSATTSLIIELPEKVLATPGVPTDILTPDRSKRPLSSTEVRETLAAVAVVEHLLQERTRADVSITSAPKSLLSAPTVAELEKQAAVDDGIVATVQGGANVATDEGGIVPAVIKEALEHNDSEMVADGNTVSGDEAVTLQEKTMQVEAVADFLNYMRDVHRRVEAVSRSEASLARIKPVKPQPVLRSQQVLFRAGHIEIYDSEKGVVAVEMTKQAVVGGHEVVIGQEGDHVVDKGVSEAQNMTVTADIKEKQEKVPVVDKLEVSESTTLAESKQIESPVVVADKAPEQDAVMLIPAAVQSREKVGEGVADSAKIGQTTQAVDKNELLRSVLQVVDEIAQEQVDGVGEGAVTADKTGKVEKNVADVSGEIAFDEKDTDVLPEDGGAIDLMKNIVARN